MLPEDKIIDGKQITGGRVVVVPHFPVPRRQRYPLIDIIVGIGFDLALGVR